MGSYVTKLEKGKKKHFCAINICGGLAHRRSAWQRLYTSYQPGYNGEIYIYYNLRGKFLQKRRKTELKATALFFFLAKCRSAECTCSFRNENDTSRNKRRIKNTILDGFFRQWTMYLLVFIHLGHNMRFWPARCVKSLLLTPQPSLLPLQWEKWRQYSTQMSLSVWNNPLQQRPARVFQRYRSGIIPPETVFNETLKDSNLKNVFFYSVLQYKLRALVKHQVHSEELKEPIRRKIINILTTVTFRPTIIIVQVWYNVFWHVAEGTHIGGTLFLVN